MDDKFHTHLTIHRIEKQNKYNIEEKIENAILTGSRK